MDRPLFLSFPLSESLLSTWFSMSMPLRGPLRCVSATCADQTGRSVGQIEHFPIVFAHTFTTIVGVCPTGSLCQTPEWCGGADNVSVASCLFRVGCLQAGFPHSNRASRHRSMNGNGNFFRIASPPLSVPTQSAAIVAASAVAWMTSGPRGTLLCGRRRNPNRCRRGRE